MSTQKPPQCEAFGHCAYPSPHHFTGDLYAATKECRRRGLAREIRAKISQGKRAGVLPRSPRITVAVERVGYVGASVTVPVRGAPESEAVKAELLGILRRFNYDHGDPLSDYWCARFFERVRFIGEAA